MSVNLVTLPIVVIFFTTFYLFVKSQFSYWKRRGVVYLKPSIPFGNFGATFLGKKSFGQVTQDLYNATDEPVVGVFTLTRPTLLVRDPRIIRDILIKDFHKFHHRGFHQNEDVDPLGANLLMQNGDKWRKMRATLSPAFTSGKLKQMFETIVSCSTVLEKHINQFAISGEKLEICDILARISTNLIASIAFGIDIDCIKNPDEEFRKHGRRFFAPLPINAIRFYIAFMSPMLSKLFRLRFADKEVTQFMTETVRQNLEYRERNNVMRKDFFQLLIQLRNAGKVQDDGDWQTTTASNKKALNLDEVTAQSFIFFLGGFETASTTMSFCLYELAKNQEIQQRAYEEIVQTLQNHDGKLTYDSMLDMKYLENCIDETVRKHPPVEFITRQCTQDYKITDSDVIIEDGTLILFSVAGLHYDEKYFSEPERFDPDRFNGDQTFGKNITDMPYLAFGGGPRNCIGMRLGKLTSKISICLLLRKFKFELDERHLNQKLEFDPMSLVRAPHSGINLKVTIR